jgi:hypothetical protein
MGNKGIYCVMHNNIVVNTNFIAKSAPSKESIYDLQGFAQQKDAYKLINDLYEFDIKIKNLLDKADIYCPLVKEDMEAFYRDAESADI